MNQRFKIILMLLPSLIGIRQMAIAQAVYPNITNYRVYYGWLISENSNFNLIISRQFENNGQTYFLTVNPNTLETKTVAAGTYPIMRATFDEVKNRFKNTAYERALQEAEVQSAPLQNAGITTGSPQQKGISLTADLCPSHRPLDRRIFTAISSTFNKGNHPAPIALSITGVWITQHPQDLEWLKKIQADGKIDITWINHSYNHRVSATLPLKQNFLLETGTDINYEVLETEKAMLKNGLTPSVFFRFPGLVSDKQLVHKITEFGLIPIGADAWLAKGQQPHNGSIVLIHANGNEPVGVEDFLKLLQLKATEIADGRWLLYDLKGSIVKQFDGDKL